MLHVHFAVGVPNLRLECFPTPGTKKPVPLRWLPFQIRDHMHADSSASTPPIASHSFVHFLRFFIAFFAQ